MGKLQKKTVIPYKIQVMCFDNSPPSRINLSLCICVDSHPQTLVAAPATGTLLHYQMWSFLQSESHIQRTSMLEDQLRMDRERMADQPRLEREKAADQRLQLFLLQQHPN